MRRLKTKTEKSPQVLASTMVVPQRRFSLEPASVATQLQFCPAMPAESTPDFFSVELEGRPAHVYNERAFRYFLSIEVKRSERTGRPFALLLLEWNAQRRLRSSLDSELATRLFSGLSLCLRETDFVGWYQEGTVAAAVLTHLGDTPGADITHQIRRRFNQAAFTALVPEIAEDFVLRVYQLPAQEFELGENRR
jgi:hypothetical protein